MRETWTFHSAGQIVFGRNSVQQLGEIAQRLGAKRVVIVTDPILTKSGLLDRVKEPLAKVGLNVEAFTGGEPEPSMKAAVVCMELCQHFQPDALVGLGGGSNMDLAKICAVLLAHGG